MARADDGPGAQDRIRARHGQREAHSVGGREGGVPARLDVQAGRRRCLQAGGRALYYPRGSGARLSVHVQPVCRRPALRTVHGATGAHLEGVGSPGGRQDVSGGYR